MNQLRNYLIVTLAYWSFMLTDGALRMLVLLHFHQLGYSPLKLATLFLLYEFFGIVTNLFGGWLGNRFGLKMTLTWGLLLQVFALLMLSFLNPTWSVAISVPFVMIAQALSGIAKDLTKMSSKTAIKYLIPSDQGSKMFKWVSLLTGSKNSIKGLGFFVGGILLSLVGFKIALCYLALLIGIVYIFSVISLPQELGRAKQKSHLKQMFTQGRNINLLSLARIFLFGARDIWFVVALPLFLTQQFGWSFTIIGSFMASWVICYGVVQAFAPGLIRNRTKEHPPDGKIAVELLLALVVTMATITILFFLDIAIGYTIVIGLLIFGIVFALNSSVHSFLIIDYADGDKAALNVGFYYMANAMGRLLGTLLSGILFQWGGLLYCLIGSTLFLTISFFVSLRLPKRI